ncbi:hypothetical protein [Pseudovibrio sp. Tun.PSC04-5.I4]|uniref:hypothetical protein n=1 Tax=Pseudovibrio sp. Tun.PSC04-5.I4 TaxID=1798213 RepID=UPI000A9D7907|nr:hypothetical protein [Pseudovibrio sp. Tun.PSC04-5.I4]
MRHSLGPLGIVVKQENLDQMHDVVKQIDGQLTCSVHVDAADYADARKLMPLLECKAGRVLTNGFPAGGEVCDAAVHGVPYPVFTNFGATFVGIMAICRFLPPVSYQDIPLELISGFEVDEKA